MSRMGTHIDERHLGCGRTRLSSRSGVGSGPGVGGWSRKRPPSQAGSRARSGHWVSLVSLPGPAGRSLKSGRLVGLAQAGPPGGLVMGTRKHVCTQRGRPLQPALAASFTTAGVRADRVGAKLPWRAIATEGAGKAKAAWPLTRETSAGSLRCRRWARASATARGDEGEPLDPASRRSPAVAGWGAASVVSRSWQKGSVFQRLLPNACVLTDGRGTGRGMVGRGSDGPIGRARGLC